MSLFELENITKVYRSDDVVTEVLRGISFQVEKGEFVSVMGPSGSGKSTLLHILGFLADHTDGVYRFNGKQFEEYTDNEIARVRNEKMGFVFQTFNLLGRSTVYENVRLPLVYSRRPEKDWNERIKKVVEQVGLSHRLDYETFKLSGGEKQRVAIARALVNEPEVIFADEPTGNLDSVSGGAVMDTLQRLHIDFGHTVMLITHETTTAMHAERIIKIMDGKVESDKKVTKRSFAGQGYSK